MTFKEFSGFCHALPATTYVVQWGGFHVWKVGGKVFAIGGWEDDEPGYTFKVTGIAYEIFKVQPGLRPAAYLASRGMQNLGCGMMSSGIYPPIAFYRSMRSVKEEASRAGNRYAPAFIATKHSEREFRPLNPSKRRPGH